ncbi:D-glycero-alpha-D-manno-heptose-1,7-bisphosphate 7-phosphatase [Lacicoccus qingdaonensis]|uniref:D,D-heptose 1,7-bisphosphate phosphatase n=1 Tax=Lacicoccus qingdaonensis TaxID=576118 RepID=A0A1G9H2S5_9BACL|nr:HAD family hydrolase [Salinicoccus qingdaonensis]SDL07211.1 D-glycero-D-manno-heptose 1,7-bisphosphate phosphatase [Salinicoccus qingdaonensis]
MSKAVFLDRDGVINEVLTKRVKFVNTPDDFYLLDGVGEGIRKLNASGCKVFVVTNQGGVGLGFMTEQDLHDVHYRMESDLARFGAYIDDIAYCPDKPHVKSWYRKPSPGMILDLAQKHRIDLASSYMAGDRDPDILAGRNAGTKTVFLGNDKKQKEKADLHFPTLLSFATWLTD